MRAQRISSAPAYRPGLKPFGACWLLAAALLLLAAPALAQDPVLSEIRIDQSGGDDDEYFELAGPAATDLTGLTYLVIGDGTGGSGVIEEVTDLSGNSIPGSGFFVAAEGTFSLATADLTTDLNFENSDNVTHLLVRNFTGTNGDDLDTNDDGTLDTTPWSAIVDCVALVETPGSGEQTYCATTLGPDGTFVPGHSYFCPTGWEIGAFTPLGTDDTPGAANPCPAMAFLSEIRIDQSGGDDDEYFELEATPGTDLTGLTYLVIGDGTGGSGVVEEVTDLTGSTVPASGFFVAAEGTFSLATADLTTDLNFENSDNVTHLLVRSFTGSNGDDLDTNDDGTLDTTPWSEIVDCIALVETPGSGDQIYCATTVGPDGTFVPGHSYFCPAGWEIGAFTPVGSDDTPGAANPCIPPPPAVTLNEVRIDQSGGDDDEYFEIEGAPGTDLTGLTFLVIGDGTGGSGVIEEVTDLAGSSVPGSGFFVAAEGTFSLGTADLTTDLNFENSDNVTHLIVAGFTGSNGDDLDTDDDGTLDTTPWTEIVDCVALVETPGSGDQIYCATTVGPDGTFVPGHAFLCPAGWQIGAFTPVGTDDTPGAFNTPCTPPPPAVTLSEIRIDQSGGDDDEYFEIEGAPGAMLAGLSYLVIGDGTGGSGVIEEVTDLTGSSIPGSGFFVAAEGTFSLGTADLTTALNFENSDNVTHLIVAGFSGANGDDLDTDDDGTLDVTPWSTLVDCVALVETPGSGDQIYCATTVGPDGTFVPGHSINCPAGWQIGTFDPVGTDDTPGAANACVTPPVILSEIRIDQSGGDDDEYFELAGPGGTGLNSVSYLVIGDGTGGSGVIEEVTDLTGSSIPAGGFFVAAEGTFSLGTADLTTDLNFENSDNATHLIVLGFSGANGDDLDTDDDGTLDVTPWAELIDCVALVETPGSGDQIYCATTVGPDGANVPGHAIDCPQGWQVGIFDPIGMDDTPGSGNICPPPTPVEIYEIQGNNDTPPLLGQRVNTVDNIVTAVTADGFFIQTPDARDDLTLATSNGIFILTENLLAPPVVQVGDQVDLVGTVLEHFDLSAIEPEAPLDVPNVTIDSSGNPLPTAVVFNAATPSPDPNAPSCGGFEYECYEAMLVAVTGGVVCGPNQRFSTDIVAEVHITAATSRCFREPGVEFPGLMMPPIPTWDGNPEVFELDPNRAGLPNETIPAGSTFDAMGVLGFEFGGFEIWPTQLTTVPPPVATAVPEPVRPTLPGELTIGSLNLFRLFDDIDDPGPADDGSVLSMADYNRRLDKFLLYIRDILRHPDILGVQEVEKLDVLQDLADLIATDDPTVIYTPFLEEGNDIGGIDVGFLVRDNVQVDAVTQLGAGELLSVDSSLLHDRPPLLLEGSYIGNGAPFPLAVMVNHTRSLSGIDDPTNGPRVRQKRLEQAQSIAQKVQDFQTANPTVPFVMVGDLNAFEFTDGYVDVVGQMAGDFDPTESLLSGPDLVNPDLSKQVLNLPADERYSFIFRGNAQVLDHALTSTAADLCVRGFEYGRANADAAFDLINDDSTPLRSSDHDGLVLYLMSDFDDDGFHDDQDNCPADPNPDQADGDGDGIGDVCDTCVDGDPPLITLQDQDLLSASGIVEDCSGIQSLALSPDSVNTTLITAGNPGDAIWSWTVTVTDHLQPASATVIATDTLTLTAEFDFAYEGPINPLEIPTLDHRGLLALILLLTAAALAALRRRTEA